MSFFDQIEEVPLDPLFALDAAFQSDSRAHKVNLGIGIYRAEDEKSFVFSSIRKADKELRDAELPKNYLPIGGDTQFLRLTEQLVFGEDHPALNEGCIYSAQTVGGTGALSIAAFLMSKKFGIKNIYVPTPTWVNHYNIFQAVGMKVETYPYFDHDRHQLDFDGLCKTIKQMPAESAIVLHASCHNPTGVDIDEKQWIEIHRLLSERSILPVFDCAYQGFGRGIVEDVFSLRYFAEQGGELLAAYSYSKAMGLYGERLGAFFAVAKSSSTAAKLGSQTRAYIRAFYSNPPLNGARLAVRILSSPELKENWLHELDSIRNRLSGMREALSAGLKKAIPEADFSFLNRQVGLFSFCDLQKNQVDKLIGDYAIYLPSNGRVNISGLNSKNLKYVIDAIAAVKR